jgi:DNA adenine methylase
MLNNSKTKPIIKWAGGKTKLLPYIIENLPNKEFKNYFEPFVGGASVIIELLSKDIEYKANRQYTISDINESLINVYNVVKNNLDDLIRELTNETYTNVVNNYNINRNRFNEIKFNNDNRIERAALFIYLNKCGFNGMYRENKSGKYNIPFGSMKNPKICDNITLNNFKTIMKDVNIFCCEYQDTFDLIEKNDLVYLDPPYHETFTDYTANKFGEDEQRELKLFVDKLTEKGVNVMISNSATDFIKDLYKEYTIINITTKYSLGGKGANRGNKEEVLIKNF